MDNEEIRKLLQELKESSDESSSVRSKIVKIHIDTPEEAQRRERAKKKAREKEERRLAEEALKAEAEEEARRLAAQKAAEEAVEEAKREAKSGFAPDLDEDLLSAAAAHQEAEATGSDPSDADLGLNWGYEIPELKSGLVREEDLNLGPAEPGRGTDDGSGLANSGRGTDDGSGLANSGRNKKGRGNGQPDDGEPSDGASEDGAAGSGRKRRFGWLRSSGAGDEDGFESDEGDFRSADEDLPARERESITGLPGRFGALSDGVLSFFGGVRRSVKEDLSKARERKEPTKEEDGETDDAPDSTSGGRDIASRKRGDSGVENSVSRKRGDTSAENFDPGKRGDTGVDNSAARRRGTDAGIRSELGNGVTVGADPEPVSGNDPDWVYNASPDPSKEMQELPSYWSEEEDSGRPGRADDFEDPYSTDGLRGNDTDRLHEFPSGKAKPGRTTREYGPDEDWKRRMEEAPRKKTFFQRMRLERAASSSFGGRKKKKEESSAVEETGETSERADRTEISDRHGEAAAPGGSDGLSEASDWPEMTKVPEASGRPEITRSSEAPAHSKTTALAEAEEDRDGTVPREKEGSPRKAGWFQKLKRPGKSEAPELTELSEPAESFEPAKAPELAEVSEQAKTLEMAEIPEKVKKSEPAEIPELAEVPESATDREAGESQEKEGSPRKAGWFQKLKRSGKSEAPELTESSEWAESFEPTKTPELKEAPEKAKTPELKEASEMAEPAPAETSVTDALPGTGELPGTKEKHPADIISGTKEKFPAGKELGTEEESLKSIEVIDLNENQNNKDVEVIPLTGDTGALPDLAQLKKEVKKGRRKKKASPDGDYGPARGAGIPRTAGGGIGTFFQSHRKMILIAAAIIALVVAAVVIITLLSGRMSSKPRETISADEGLTVYILEQPDSYTGSGDVQIRVKAPETIQSVTVNGENVVIDQGRTVEFNYHASGGTLDIMAVSTDKVRNAKVVLAYVDSQAPTVTIKEEDGKIALSAEDTESGLEGIYIGTTSGLSDVPQYEKYTEPLEKDPNREITYFAKDLAGNTTTPAVVALTPAESIAFSTERYSLFPGSTERVSLVTTPEHAFVNNLKLESENSKVVQVEGDMQIRGLAEGDTKITATADGIAGAMASVSVMGERKVKISAIGDCTLGTDASFSQNTSFNAFEALYGSSYFFEKVKAILSSGDSAFANFEGTLTTSDQREQKTFAFKGDPSYTQILVDAGIDVVNLANNHSRDYGEESLTDTQNALESAGIEWCMGDHIAYRDLNGVLTAYIGIYALENGLDSLPQVKSTIAQAKKRGADLIIVEFHWGAELVREIDDFQKELAHTAIDEGANLVLGSHAHVLQGIEKYKDAYIVYGLSNFCFGGNSDPTSYDTIIWQQTFTFSSDGLEPTDEIAIIPCQVSGDLNSNNYQPVPVSGDAAATIMRTIDDLSAQFGQSYSAYMVDGTLWTSNGQQDEN